MSTNPTAAARNAQHTDVHESLESDLCPLDDITPYEDDNDMTTTRPCAYCGFTDCPCDDTDGAYSHITHRRGW